MGTSANRRYLFMITGASPLGWLGVVQPTSPIILQLQWVPVFSGKMYIINSAFSLSTILIYTLNRIWDPKKSTKEVQDFTKPPPKKIYMVTPLDQDYVYKASKLQPMLSTNKVVCVCQVSKLQHIYAMGLTLLSVLKTTKHTRLYQI